MAKVSGWLLAAILIGLLPQSASADSRVYSVAPYGAPAVVYDRGEGLFYQTPPYYWTRYYGFDPYSWHYRNSGRYGQPYNQARSERYHPRAFYHYVQPSAAIYHREPDAMDTRKPGDAPTGSVPQPVTPNKSPQQKEPDVKL